MAPELHAPSPPHALLIEPSVQKPTLHNPIRMLHNSIDPNYIEPSAIITLTSSIIITLTSALNLSYNHIDLSYNNISSSPFPSQGPNYAIIVIDHNYIEPQLWSCMSRDSGMREITTEVLQKYLVFMICAHPHGLKMRQWETHGKCKTGTRRKNAEKSFPVCAISYSGKHKIWRKWTRTALLQFCWILTLAKLVHAYTNVRLCGYVGKYLTWTSSH